MTRDIFRAAGAAVVAILVAATSAVAQTEADATIEEALAATVPGIAENATVVDWEGNVLREGSNGWTCLPTPPGFDGVAPMCLDEPWMAWAEAWQNKTEPAIDRPGVAYMLGGDTGASNSDPYATDPSAVDDWVDAGNHLMILVPDPAMLEGLPTDPANGGPWVMWKGTPYAHIMVPAFGADGSTAR